LDIFSLAVGFVVGAITVAAGHYFGEKYTDKRRTNEFSTSLDKEWKDIEKRFPEIIAEMKVFAKDAKYSHIRNFFLHSSKTSVNSPNPAFSFYTDVFPDIFALTAHLEDLGYIVDITPGNTPMFRMKENLIDKLKNS